MSIPQAVGETAKVVLQTKAMAITTRAENVGPRNSWSCMKQPTFNWNSKDMYTELRNFKLKVKNMFQNCNINKEKECQLKKTG